MNTTILDDSFFQELNLKLIDQILDEIPFRRDFGTSEWSKYLMYYLILTYGTNKIPEISKDILYTSRYYWLKKFHHCQCKHNGPDAGIEQQIGALLEEMSNNLPDYDWSLVEKISTDIEQKM